MNTLRAKITLLLVAAILAVVFLATVLSFFLLERPRLDKAIDAAASQIALAYGLATNVTDAGAATIPSGIGDGSIVGLKSAPADGTSIDRAGRDLRDKLRERGLSLSPTVTQSPEFSSPVASLDLGDGRWLVMPIAIPTPPANASLILGGWMLLIAAGTTVAAIAAAYSMTRPLALVEKALAGVGPDGALPYLPETGPTEVKSTARAINLLSDRLKVAMESRMRLVAAAGHDLRTPLTRMRLRAEFLDQDERGKWLADLDELDRIADSAIRLVREEVEDAAAQDVRLDVLAGEIVAEIKEMKLDAVVTRAEPVFVRVRPLALRRALRNLVINAATHGGGATVAVRADRTAACILIEDHGPGIPEALLQRVFEPFFRVDPARRTSHPGAGLGLAIAKEIIDRSRGQLKLANRPDGGLRQEIRLSAFI
jgi:signal transduction histidine kinase